MNDMEQMFVSGDEYTQLVSEIVTATEPVDIAVAFLGAGAERLLSTSANRRLICNLESGATNPAVVKALRDKPNFEVKSLSSLHAKVIMSRSMVLCGSANISANGLGLESAEVSRWNEAGIFSKDPSLVEATGKWFADLWQNALNIDDEDICSAEIRWKARRFARPFGACPSSDEGLFSYILANPEFVLDRPIHLVVYREYASVEANNAFIGWKKAEGMTEDAVLDFYEDWSELPNNAYLIDIHYGSRGGISSGGLYWTGPERITKIFNRGPGTGEVRIVFKQEAYNGLRVIRRELNDFIDTVTPFVRKKCKDSSAFVVPLTDVMTAIASRNGR